jgi:hypothetical protein
MDDGLDAAVGRLSVIAVTGLGLGLLVGGVLGRLAMFLLIRASPEAQGVVSDDGFEMGRFTLSGTLNLMLVAAILGVIGAGIYATVRWLQPPGLALRVVVTAACAGIGVGALLVHQDGVDFTSLDADLAIALFVLVPGLYGGLLALVVESVLARHPGGLGPSWAKWLGLVPFVLAPVFLPVLASAWFLRRWLGHTRLAAFLRGRAWRTVGRVIAASAFLVLARDLLLDTAALT